MTPKKLELPEKSAEDQGQPGLAGFFAKSAAIAALAAVSSILGFVVGGYSSWVSLRRPELTFAVKPGRTEAVRSAAFAALSVEYAGQPLSGDVSSIRVALWNAGRGPIRREDVRRDVMIMTQPPTPILAASSVPLSEDDPMGLALEVIEPSRTMLKVAWDALDEGEGALIDILYNGSPQVQVGIEGRVIGQRRITTNPNKVGFASPEEEFESLTWVSRNWRLGGPVVALLFAVGLLVCLYKFPREPDPARRRPSPGWRASVSFKSPCYWRGLGCAEILHCR